MRDHIRCLMTALFGVQWVNLTDDFGEVRVRLVHFKGGRAYPHDAEIAFDVLKDDGREWWMQFWAGKGS